MENFRILDPKPYNNSYRYGSASLIFARMVFEGSGSEIVLFLNLLKKTKIFVSNLIAPEPNLLNTGGKWSRI